MTWLKSKRLRQHSTLVPVGPSDTPPIPGFTGAARPRSTRSISRRVPAPPVRVATPEIEFEGYPNDALEELKALASSKVAKQAVNRRQKVREMTGRGKLGAREGSFLRCELMCEVVGDFMGRQSTQANNLPLVVMDAV